MGSTEGIHLCLIKEGAQETKRSDFPSKGTIGFPSEEQDCFANLFCDKIFKTLYMKK